MKETLLIGFNEQKVFLGAKKHVLGVQIKSEPFWSFLEGILVKSGSNLGSPRHSLNIGRLPFLSIMSVGDSQGFHCRLSKIPQ